MKNDDRYGGNKRNDGDRGARGGKRPYGADRPAGDSRRRGAEDRSEGGGRKSYGGSRFEGPARRTWDDRGPGRSNPPRVGRVARDVPRAQRVDDADPAPRRVSGERSYRQVSREAFSERGRDRGGRGGELHRGGAWRSESGPRGWQAQPRPDDAQGYEPPEIPEELAAEFSDVAVDEHLLAGRNPIREALKAGRPVEKLLVTSGDLSGTGREIVRLAKEAGVVVQQVDRARLDQIYPAHQGMLAYVAAVPYTPLEDILQAAKDKGEDPFIVVLDGITDPHNLGAIIRSAECAGAHGVVVPERRAAGLSPAAAKAAAGALDHMPVARVKNLNRALETLKQAGVWIIGTALRGEDAQSADLTGPVALVIGSEGDGISRLTLEKCDRTVSLPMKGHIDSLNASVAAGILMYEVVRQRAK